MRLFGVRSERWLDLVNVQGHKPRLLVLGIEESPPGSRCKATLISYSLESKTKVRRRKICSLDAVRLSTTYTFQLQQPEGRPFWSNRCVHRYSEVDNDNEIDVERIRLNLGVIRRHAFVKNLHIPLEICNCVSSVRLGAADQRLYSLSVVVL
jgi:hypothetical protein